MQTTETVFNQTNEANEANAVNEVINAENSQLAENGEDEDEDEDEDEESELFNPAYANEALDKLRDEYNQAGEAIKLVKAGGKKFQAISEQLGKLSASIRAEISGIKKLEREAEMKAKEAKMMMYLTNIKEAATRATEMRLNGSPVEVVAEYEAFLQVTLDEAANELILGKVGAPKVASGQNGQSGSPAHGSVRSEVERLYSELTAKGLNVTEAIKAIKEQGFSRGSTNTYVRDFRLKIGEISE